MKISISNLDLANKTAQVSVGDKNYITKLILPANKGKENELWVDLRPLKSLFGDGEHKNWATLPRDTIKAEAETLKVVLPPRYVSILNLMNYVSEEEYKQCKAIFDKAEIERRKEELEYLNKRAQ